MARVHKLCFGSFAQSLVSISQIWNYLLLLVCVEIRLIGHFETRFRSFDWCGCHWGSFIPCWSQTSNCLFVIIRYKPTLLLRDQRSNMLIIFWLSLALNLENWCCRPNRGSQVALSKWGLKVWIDLKLVYFSLCSSTRRPHPSHLCLFN